MKEIKTVGVVGFGVMGAAIGLNAAMSGYKVVFKELNDDLVKAMYDKFVAKAMAKRVEQGKMSKEEADKICGMIKGTKEFKDLAVCDLIIEAVVENINLKVQCFEEISKVVPKDTIIVSNTSTFPIATLMAKVDNPARTAGLHYFFPANVNRLVEVIRQKATSDDTYQALMAFGKGNKKVPITVSDFPGFAVNPVFIAAYMVLDLFAGGKYNIATLESISQEFLGLKFGIMWVQKGAGLGTCYHAAVSMLDYLGKTDIGYPPVPAFLKKSFDEKADWNLADGPVLEDKAARSAVGEVLLGSIFCISKHLIAKKVVSIEDLDLGIRTSLAWPKGPFAMMNDMGAEKTKQLMQKAVDAGYFKMPPM
ncbi:MAG: 3-hydroxyacyl-CoA dehydrogenase family protein [Spirochaetota bacterium]